MRLIERRSLCQLVLLVLAFFSTIETVQGQDYGEYARGGVARRRNNRGPIVAVAAGGVFGGLLGWAATAHTMRRKYGAEKKELLQYIQLQNEVYKEREKQWQQEYQKLFNQFEQLERETVERDYEEFKAPDTNNDDMISKKEFEAYVTKYLSSFPELSEKDFPKFDDFDLDGDGQVSFEEWQEFLQMQKQQEAKKKESGKGTTKSQYADLINALYDSSTSANGFTGMQKNLAEKKRRQ